MPITNPDYSNLNHDEMASSIGLKAKHMPMLIGSFLEETESILENLQTAISSSDLETIKSTAHSIKGSAGNLRLTELYEMSKEMELAAGENNSAFEYAVYFNAIKQAVSTIKI